ncbi:glycosyltransferase family 2 protein [Aquirufa echingensis]|uniref:Glycosyltransferase family 2 protein n=1 Tax=Aquirufa echingensis TaxID=3096516 RepID=A0ABW6CWE6_9BACT
MNFDYLNKDIYGQPTLTEHPKVSICVISYNHQNYVKTCLNSILEQKVDFAFEIILGEDCSKDQTAEIIKQYADQYPHLIKAYIRQKNVGAKTNFLHCFLQCKGEYIVFIEADDYWTDPLKLQRQVDFLDQHPHASACFHNAQIIFEDGSNREPVLINPIDQKPWVESADFLVEKETWFMATAAVMMRRKFAQPLPEWFLHSKSGDIPLYVILAEQGPIGYLPEVMSVYRKNEGGISMTDHVHADAFIKNRIFMYSSINAHTKYKYNHLIKPILQAYYLMRMDCHENKSNKAKQAFYFSRATLLNPPRTAKDWKSYLKTNLLSPKNLLTYLNFRSKLNKIIKR